MVSLGLAAVGYEYVNVGQSNNLNQQDNSVHGTDPITDDTWSNITGRDPTTQRIKPDSNKFPSGIASLASSIHALGLKFGVYGQVEIAYVKICSSDAKLRDEGTLTCSGYPGSLGYELIDAQTFSDWGVDCMGND